jgi:aryl-alcohol dehydrogenase-like predicted oxidoreductase
MMSLVALGNTGIQVSRVGLGTVKFGRNEGVRYPKEFKLPDDQTIVNLLSAAREARVNLLDTAPAYGTSEMRLGKLLKNQRKEWVLCTKAGEEFVNGQSFYDFSASAIQRSIERSLKRLGTDYLDIVLIHSNGEDQKIIEQDAVFETLAEIKKAGKIRSFGMSTKTNEGGKLAVDHSDVVMVTYNPVEMNERAVIDYAHQKNKGIFIKKGLVSGHLDKIDGENPVFSAMRFIFAEPGVTSVILGTLSIDHFREDILWAAKALSR